MNEKKIMEVCSGLEYQCAPKNSLVIRFGEEGDKFYLVLRGRVEVWLPTERKPMQEKLRKVKKQVNETNLEHL